MEQHDKIAGLKGHLIVSCQALEDEPLHSSFIMGRMAKAAEMGGAAGIRANTVPDITQIRTQTALPIIGIIKKEYPDSEVYITPTIREVEALRAAGPEIIAADATRRPRPNGESLESFYHTVRRAFPDQYLMADCSCVEEAIYADQLGFDFIGTTLVGYTSYTRSDRIEADDFAIIRAILSKVHHPVIAEGNIDTPGKAGRVIKLGCFSVVVGGAITRPQLITAKFAQAIPGEASQEGKDTYADT